MASHHSFHHSIIHSIMISLNAEYTEGAVSGTQDTADKGDDHRNISRKKPVGSRIKGCSTSDYRGLKVPTILV